MQALIRSSDAYPILCNQQFNPIDGYLENRYRDFRNQWFLSNPIKIENQWFNRCFIDYTGKQRFCYLGKFCRSKHFEHSEYEKIKIYQHVLL